jgi:hypothetical protein
MAGIPDGVCSDASSRGLIADLLVHHVQEQLTGGEAAEVFAEELVPAPLAAG